MLHRSQDAEKDCTKLPVREMHTHTKAVVHGAFAHCALDIGQHGRGGCEALDAPIKAILVATTRHQRMVLIGTDQVAPPGRTAA